MPRILFVDDEPIFIQAYVEEFRLRGIDVEIVKDADACMKAMADHPAIDLFIIDVMLPPGEAFDHSETSGGRITGLLLSRAVRQLYPDTPIVVLTQIAWGSLRPVTEAAADDLGDAILVRKAETPAYELAEKVSKILADGISAVGRTSLLAELGKSIVLQPTIAGIGVDLKTFIECLIERYRKR